MFVYTRKAHYHETDQMGVVHHANYPKWMEEARVAFLDALGVSYGAMEAAGVYSPVVHLSIDYKRPARFDDEVEVQLAIAKYTGVRLEVGYTFFNRTRNELCATAASSSSPGAHRRPRHRLDVLKLRVKPPSPSCTEPP